MGSKTKIDWCDATWNPVTGCLHGCEYCYARRIAERFGGGWRHRSESADKSWRHWRQSNDGLSRDLLGGWAYHANRQNHVLNEQCYRYPCCPIHPYRKKAPYPYFFDPTFHRYKLDEPQKWKKPRSIFVCSMADLFGDWVPDEWIQEVFKACEAAPQHRYLFLTKNPKRYKELQLKGKLPKQHWYGTSVTRKDDRDFFAPGYNTFVSIEPILESFSDEKHAAYRQMVQPWVILGAETGNRKNKIVPKKEWITELVDYYSKFGYTKFFMKESLRDLMGADFRQEFPWVVGGRELF